jgi:hypothetical protein
VYDVAAHKLGTVAHVHPAAGAGGDDVLEVRTGLFGLGRHLFVPRGAVRDVTEGGVFLGVTRDEIHERGWDHRPPDLDAPAAAPDSGEAAPPPAAEPVEGAPGTWEAAAPRYRARWLQRYGEGTRWEAYEARYRFAWELGQLPDLAGRAWAEVEPELRRRWEVLHPETEWATVAEGIRDAWTAPPA